MSKICHITSVHRWNDVRIFEKECSSLAAAGYETHLVALGSENQTKNNVHVHSAGAVLPRSRRMKQGVKQVLEKALNTNAQVYHLHDPELLQIVKDLKRSGGKVIYDAHEDLPKQIKDKHWIPGILRSPASSYFARWENKKAGLTDAVIGATQPICDRFASKNIKAITVRNFPSLKFFTAPPDWNKRTNEICYVGGLFETRGVTELVQALEIFPTSCTLAGNFSPATFREKLSQLKGWKHITEAGFLDHASVLSLLHRVKAGVVTLHPTPSYLEALPVKLFEYMAAGIPVIASNFEVLKNIVEKHRCGLCVDPKDPEQIAQAIQYLAEHDEEAKKMGENGRKAVEQEYSWEQEEKKLIDLYKEILG